MSAFRWAILIGAASAASAVFWLLRGGRLPKPEFTVTRKRGGRWTASIAPSSRR